jgi:predicted DNA-binding protein YlxM (UPF0122 family)
MPRSRETKFNITREELVELFSVNDMSVAKIAEIYNVSASLVKVRIKQYNIVRSENPHTPFNLSKENLIQLYVKDRLSVSQIADKLGVTRNVILTKLAKLATRRN